jgi:hypothetical protein
VEVLNVGEIQFPTFIILLHFVTFCYRLLSLRLFVQLFAIPKGSLQNCNSSFCGTPHRMQGLQVANLQKTSTLLEESVDCELPLTVVMPRWTGGCRCVILPSQAPRNQSLATIATQPLVTTKVGVQSKL